ncbi:hypothetical protein EYF80_006740 [Liparis tanakae]|uniref:Uncharacterized protein n=1 Tax=Liparis tanakae TaxID=230148 RepID=A0A4Z2J0Z9_9TELE|nr:hypothetical protein EYF80_006740 [Liparis tanakae]
MKKMGFKDCFLNTPSDSKPTEVQLLHSKIKEVQEELQLQREKTEDAEHRSHPHYNEMVAKFEEEIKQLKKTLADTKSLAEMDQSHQTEVQLLHSKIKEMQEELQLKDEKMEGKIEEVERRSQLNYIEIVGTFEEEIKKLTEDLNEKDQMMEYCKLVFNANNEALADNLKMELEKKNQLEATLKKARADTKSMLKTYLTQQTEAELLHFKVKEMQEEMEDAKRCSCENYKNIVSILDEEMDVLRLQNIKDLNEKDSQNKTLVEQLKMELDKNNQLEATLKRARAETESMMEKYQRQKEELQLQHTKFEEMEEELSAECLNWRFRYQDLTEVSIILENICLELKKESRSIFRKKMGDRRTELDKMINKMKLKENK